MKKENRLTSANSGFCQYCIIPGDAAVEHAKDYTNPLRLYFVILYILPVKTDTNFCDILSVYIYHVVSAQKLI